jgi:hypothetical protein
MRYTRLSTYDLTKGTFAELTGIVEKGLLPTFAKEPGFVNFGLVDTGDHKVVSISIWETARAGPQVGHHGDDLGQGEYRRPGRPLTTQIGDLALFRGMPVAV